MAHEHRLVPYVDEPTGTTWESCRDCVYRTEARPASREMLNDLTPEEWAEWRAARGRGEV